MTDFFYIGMSQASKLPAGFCCSQKWAIMASTITMAAVGVVLIAPVVAKQLRIHPIIEMELKTKINQKL